MKNITINFDSQKNTFVLRFSNPNAFFGLGSFTEVLLSEYDLSELKSQLGSVDNVIRGFADDEPYEFAKGGGIGKEIIPKEYNEYVLPPRFRNLTSKLGWEGDVYLNDSDVEIVTDWIVDELHGFRIRFLTIKKIPNIGFAQVVSYKDSSLKGREWGLDKFDFRVWSNFTMNVNDLQDYILSHKKLEGITESIFLYPFSKESLPKYAKGGGVGVNSKKPLAYKIYDKDDYEDTVFIANQNELKEYLSDWNRNHETNYKSYQDFNKGEDYYAIEPIYARGGELNDKSGGDWERSLGKKDFHGDIVELIAYSHPSKYNESKGIINTDGYIFKRYKKYVEFENFDDEHLYNNLLTLYSPSEAQQILDLYDKEFNPNASKYAHGGSVNDDTPKVWVGEWSLYNEGKLIGEWIDLSEYSSGEEVMDKISELLAKWSKQTGQEREEYAVLDYENFPRSLYSEQMDEDAFDKVIQAYKVSQDRDIPLDVIGSIIQDYSPVNLEDWIDEHYEGKFDSDTDLAYNYVDNIGGLGSLGTDTTERYFDYESFGRDLAMDYSEYKNHYFRSFAKGGEIERDLSKYIK